MLNYFCIICIQLSPGAVKTNIIERMGLTEELSDESVYNYYGSQYPIGRYGLPEDLANAILFISSNASSFTTGTIMVIDGGHLAKSINFTLD